MADSKLKFFNKSGNPLNFAYVGPTGPTPLDFKLLYVSSSTSNSKGQLDVSNLDNTSTLVFNIQDTNGFNITGWANELSYFLERGAEVDITLDILPENQFRGRVSSITVGGSSITVVFSQVNGLVIISTGKNIKVTTNYAYRPGGYFTGNIYFDQVSAGLYENQQIFVVEEGYGLSTEAETWSSVSSGSSLNSYIRSVFTGSETVLVAGEDASAGLFRYSTDGGQNFTPISITSQIVYGLGWNGLSGSSSVFLLSTLSSSDRIFRGTGSSTSPTVSAASSIPAIPGGQKNDMRGVAFTNQSGGGVAISVGRLYSNLDPTGGGTSLASVIWRSTDSGDNWTDISPASTSGLWDVVFQSGNGFIVGEDSILLFSSDSGASWTATTSPASSDFRRGFLLPNGKGFAVGTGGVLITTGDFGQSWSALDTGVSVDLYDVYFWDSMNGFIVGDGGIILRTKNGGFSWLQQTSPTSSDLLTVYADPSSSNYGFAGGSSETVISANIDIELQYLYPRAGSTGAAGPSLWRTRWESDNYGDVDVSEVIFTYKIVEGAGGTGGEQYPLIVSYPNIAIPVDYSVDDYYSNGYLISGSSGPAHSEALPINVALNATDLYADVYQRKLIVEDLSSGTPEKVLVVDFYGEVVGEDERFNVMLQNLGRTFYAQDANILRDSDPKEPLPNFLEINEKRKELLFAGDQIYNYIGAYKGLINALKFFGYQDLRIKEYWLNLAYNSVERASPLLQNNAFLAQYQYQNGGAYSQSVLISDVLDNANKGKYRLEQTYGPGPDGTYVLDVSSESTLVPSRTYKKTSLFGLYYDLNKQTTDVDVYGYPVVVDSFTFTQEEVLIKLFALKERLKATYLPLNARIVDICGEGIYFTVYNTKAWTDSMVRSDIQSGFYLDIVANPDFGFIEDLRAFSTRPYSTTLQTPENYGDLVNINVELYGATGSSGGALYFEGIPATGGNQTLQVYAGKQYNFNLTANIQSVQVGDYDFYLSTTPYPAQNDPLGVTGNGTTGSTPLEWYVNPQEVSTIYYYSTVNPAFINGTISVLPSPSSDFGNISDPLYYLQTRSAAENVAMVQAISNWYQQKENGNLKKLGDGIQDPNPLVDPISGQPYQNPLGMPVVLELLTDIWLWSEMSMSWSSLTLPLFNVGDYALVRQYQDFLTFGLTGGYYGTVTSINYATGEYTLLKDIGGSVTVGGELLVSPIQEYLMLTWANIDFSNMFEIEWIIQKLPTEPGLPYYYEFRGNILGYYKFSHFLPYTGKYKVICNVYDGFNAKTNVFKNNLIEVAPSTIDIDAWTRYREVEYYDWEQVYKPWELYQSIWEYPAEGMTYQELNKEMPAQMLAYATYGNNVEEGQSLYVGAYSDPIGATGYLELSQSILTPTSIASPDSPSYPGTFGFAEITTSAAHGLLVGDYIWICSSDTPEVNGNWQVQEIFSTTVFSISLTLDTSMAGVVYSSSENSVTLNGNETIATPGSIKVYIDNRLIGETTNGDNLYKTTNSLVASINQLITYPDYYASSPDPIGATNIVTIQAPDITGAQFNGSVLTTVVTGSISVPSSSASLSGGTGSYYGYTYWNETSETYPNANLKYWGVKNLDWQIFEESQWVDAYAHSWEDFAYNGEWLGGFEIHTATDGDHLKLSTATELYPAPVGVTFTAASPSTLTLQEVADQLNNSSDGYITDFYYTVMPPGIDASTLANTSDLVNTSENLFAVPASGGTTPPYRS